MSTVENITIMDNTGTIQDYTIGGGSDKNQYAMPEGTILDERYRILRVIGQGGFGITYEAVHIHNDTHVAVKEYFCRDLCARETTQTGTRGCTVGVVDEMFEEQFRADLDRFLKEARILRDFSDEESIVKVLDYFEENGTAYIVMEYLEGTTLRDHIRSEGCWDMERIVHCFGPVMEALEHVHKTGIVHRDVSPDNLILMPDGTIRLLDFGAARQLTNTQMTHSVIYKAYYSAPEQRDEKGLLGSWTDVYGLCSTMYFCLVGKEPDDVLSRLLSDELKRPSSTGADILPQAERILMKGLELDREKRVQDMKQLRTELEKVYPRISEEEKENKRLRRKRRIRMVAAAAAILLICTAITAYSLRTRIRFHFIKTQETALNGENMTPEEFAESSAGVRERLEAFAGKDGYLWEEDGQQIRFTVPAETYGEQEAEYFAWAGLARRMVCRLLVEEVSEDAESGETISEYKDVNVVRQEKDVENLERTEDGTRLVFSEEGQKRFASVLNTPDRGIRFTWDEYNEKTGYRNLEYLYETAVTAGDGESIFIPDNPEEDVSFNFDLYHVLWTNDPLPAAFGVQAAWDTIWEDPAGTMVPGGNQCKETEVPGTTVSLRYSTYAEDEFKDDMGYAASVLSFQAVLKNRLDSIGVPYAVGVNALNKFEYVVRLPLDSVCREEIENLGERPSLYMGSDRDSSYTSLMGNKMKVLPAEDGDPYELVFTSDGDYEKEETLKMLQTIQAQEKEEVFLYLEDVEIAAADLESALQTMQEAGEIRFTRWLFPEHPDMTADTEHFAKFLAVCTGQDPQDIFSMGGMEIRDEKGRVLYFDEKTPEAVCYSRAQELAELWKQGALIPEDPDLEILANGRNLTVEYYNVPVENPAEALKRVEDLYGKMKLGEPGISSIDIYLRDTPATTRTNIMISLGFRANFEKDAMQVSDYCGIYTNYEDPGDLEKLPDLYNTYMDESPFWKEKIAEDREDPVFGEIY